MTNDNRTADDIERDINDERAQMSDTINDLQKKFSVDAIVNDVGNMFRGQGGDLGRSISQTVGRNPAAVVLVGVGLAWLFLGQVRDRPASDHGDSNAMPNGRPNAGPVPNEEHYWYGGGQMSSAGARKPSDMDNASNGATGTIRNAANGVGGAVSNAADSMGHAASDMTERLSHGLEDFSEEAKARVLAARRVAHEARMSAQAAVKNGSQSVSNFFQDQPLVVGALAMALGAAIGAALPHSRIEDDTMGDSSDQLFADAQAMFREERDKLMAAAQAAATGVKDEVRDVGSDLEDLLPEGKTAGDVIVDRASDAATRVLERASGEVKHQGSGRSET